MQRTEGTDTESVGDMFHTYPATITPMGGGVKSFFRGVSRPPKNLPGAAPGDLVLLWKITVKAWLRLEFIYYSVCQNVDEFVQNWAENGMLCKDVDEEFKFRNALQ